MLDQVAAGKEIIITKHCQPVFFSRTIFAGSTLCSPRPVNALSAGMCAYAASTGVSTTALEHISKQIRVDEFRGHSDGQFVAIAKTQITRRAKAFGFFAFWVYYCSYEQDCSQELRKRTLQ